MRKFTEDELDKIGHTLGINVYHARLSKNKKDKILPDEFYRNYYNYGRVSKEDIEPEWITNLNEFIDKWIQSGLYYFCVNEKGINNFKEY
jgi:ABC-type amino acid transport substrate-binding protein